MTDENPPCGEVNVSGVSGGGDVSLGPITSGQVKGDVVGGDKIGRDQINIYQGQQAPRIPLQRPPRAQHFTDRETELAQLLADLQAGKPVTLCGPGGMGKSALAAEAIWTLAPGNEPPDQFPDGVIWYSFYTQPEAAIALEQIAMALGEEARPTPAAAAQRALAGKRVLLLLDGTEDADDLPSVQRIVDKCGLIITSRSKGDAIAERQDLSPLPPTEAVKLLQAWGGDPASDDQAAITQICEQVGGLPLAVRLVGRYLEETGENPAGYLEWLQETPIQALAQGTHRGESVEVLLQRSLAQVSEAARQVLALVAGGLAFGSFSREVVEAGLGLAPNGSRQPLNELVRYGLLLHSGERYQPSHALVHTYARRRLPPAAETVKRVAAYYEAFANEQSKLGLEGYARLDAERSHIMRVLQSCMAQSEWDSAMVLVWAIEDYLDLQGHNTERVTALEAGIIAAQQAENQYNESAWLNSLGNAYRDLGQVEKAIEYYEQALAIDKEIGYRQGEGSALGSLGLAYSDLGQVDKAIEYYEQALAISREIGHRLGEGNRLGNLGNAYSDLGQVEKAIEYYEQALAISREIGYRQSEGIDLGNLGNAYRALGQVEKAREYLSQALAIFEEIKSPYADQARKDLEELGD